MNNPTPAAIDLFGYSVSVSCSTVLVTAVNDDTGAKDAGSAYVFDAGTGALLDTVNNLTLASGDQFAQTAAISGNTLVIDAVTDDTQNLNQGAAYVYSFAPGTTVSLTGGNLLINVALGGQRHDHPQRERQQSDRERFEQTSPRERVPRKSIATLRASRSPPSPAASPSTRTAATTPSQ